MRPPSTASALIALILALCLLSADRADATIYYRTSTTTENGAGSTSIVLTVPSGVAVGDLLVASVNASGTTAITPPTGWTSLIGGAGTGYYGSESYRVATAADVAGASYTWPLGATARKATGSMLSYTGVDTTAIGAPSANAGSGTTATFTSVTTAAANSRVILTGSGFNSTSAFTFGTPTSTTSRLNFATSSAGSEVRSFSGDFLQATAGATGNKTSTISPTSSWGAVMFAVKPATGTLVFEVAPDVGILPAVALNGQAQTTTAQMSNFAVNDTTAGTGWNVTVNGDGSAGNSAVLKQYCTQSGGCGSDPVGYVAGGQTLPAGSLKLDTTGASFTGANGTPPTFQCSSACSLDAAAPTKIASAASGAGLGPWQTTGFSASSLSLSTATTLRTLPANEVYRADLVWTLSTGP